VIHYTAQTFYPLPCYRRQCIPAESVYFADLTKPRDLLIPQETSPQELQVMQWLSDVSHVTWCIVTFGDTVLCLCERLSSRSCVDVGSCLLGCTLCWWISRYRILLPPAAGSGQPNLHRLSGMDLFEQEDGGSKIVWIISNYLLFDMASHPRWLESLLKSYETHNQVFIIWLLTCSKVQNSKVIINNKRIACRN
jgi:hypothetical protein